MLTIRIRARMWFEILSAEQTTYYPYPPDGWDLKPGKASMKEDFLGRLQGDSAFSLISTYAKQ